MLLLTFVLIIIFMAAILLLSRLATGAAIRFANEIGSNYFTIGFVLVAISTSMPEFFVGIESAVVEGGVIAAANVLGANLADVGLILGMCAIMYGFEIGIQELKKNSIYIFLMSAIPLYFLVTKEINFVGGIVLLLIFCIYIYLLTKTEKRKPLGIVKLERFEVHRRWTLERQKHTFKALAIFSICLFGVMFCAKNLVQQALVLISELHIPLTFIGAVIISLGTTLPELTVSFDAMRRGHTDMCFGTLIGSCIVNLTLVLGAATLFAGKIQISGFEVVMAFLILINLLIYNAFLTNNKITKFEGALIFGAYIIFLISQIATLV